MNDEQKMREIKIALWGPEPPKTTRLRSSGFNEEQDEAFRIARWHYGFTGSRGEFWCTKDTETIRLRRKVMGMVTPTPSQVIENIGLLDMDGPGPLYRSHRQADTRQNQKKKLKRRKAVLKRHR